MEITWPSSKTCLCFRLRRIQDNPTSKEVVRIYREGEIYIRQGLGFLHFVSYSKGEVRLITTCSFRDEGDKTVEGMVLTLTESSVPLYPAASPIIMQKQEAMMSDEEVESHIGVFQCNHPLVAELNERLEGLLRRFSLP